MPISCDTCGKVATITGKPDNVHWRDWMSAVERGDDAVVALPADDTTIGVICMSCLQQTLEDWNDSRDEPTS
jgi:hypothetical protein